MIAAAVAKALVPAVAAVAGTSAAIGVGISLAVANKKKENCYHNLILHCIAHRREFKGVLSQLPLTSFYILLYI